MHADEQARVTTVVVTLGRSGSRFVRLDKPFEQPEASGAPPRPDSGGLLELIRKAIRASSSDRRGAFRHEVVDHEIWVGWWTGEHFGAELGRLDNLSRTGARIVLERKPPRRQPVWIYKELGTTLSCVRADLVGLTPAPSGSFSARFRFASPCPTVLCQAAVCGPGDRGRTEERGRSTPRG